MEKRWAPASIFTGHHKHNTDNCGGDDNEVVESARKLSQAMIPGIHLVKVEVSSSTLIESNLFSLGNDSNI